MTVTVYDAACRPGGPDRVFSRLASSTPRRVQSNFGSRLVLLSLLSSLLGSSGPAARRSRLLEEEPIPLSNLGNRVHHPGFDTHKFAMKFRYPESRLPRDSHFSVSVDSLYHLAPLSSSTPRWNGGTSTLRASCITH